MCVWLAFSVILLCWTSDNMFLWIQSQVFQSRSVPYNRVLRMGERGPVILHLSNFFIWSVDSIEGIQGIWAEAYFVIAINAVSTKKRTWNLCQYRKLSGLFHFKVSNSEALNPFRVLRRKLRTNRREKTSRIISEIRKNLSCNTALSWAKLYLFGSVRGIFGMMVSCLQKSKSNCFGSTLYVVFAPIGAEKCSRIQLLGGERESKKKRVRTERDTRVWFGLPRLRVVKWIILRLENISNTIA